MSAHDDLPPTAAALGMARHPEGGWYRRLWTASTPVLLPGRGGRAAASAVQYLLCAGEASAWHRLGAEELWLHQDGGPLVMQWGGVGHDPVLAGTVTLGPREDGAGTAQEAPGTTGAPGPALHALVPGRTWQRTLPVAREVLVTCVVSPEFTFEDFEVR